MGRIVGAHGLRGHIKVEPLTEYWERFDAGARLRLRDDWVTVEDSKVHKNRPLLKLSGIDNLDAAEALQWEYLEAAPMSPQLEEDEYLTSDLVGMTVATKDGRELGSVDEVLMLPAQDVLRIGALMIPVVKEFVKDVDLDLRRIEVELIPGMLPDEE